MLISLERMMLMLFVSMAPYRPAFAQKDMVGPDWLAMIMALPKLALYAVGEFALFLAPLLALLSFISWVATLVGKRSKGNSGTSFLVVLTVLTAVPALIYWSVGPKTPSDPFRSNRSAIQRDAKIKPLAPPVGKSWPSNTEYLDMPQGVQGGHGAIRVQGSFRRQYVKLCAASKQTCPGLRHAFVQKGGTFTFSNLPPGTYEIRHMPIDRPKVGGRSQPITVTEYIEDVHIVNMADSPVLESNYPVVGIYLKDF